MTRKVNYSIHDASEQHGGDCIYICPDKDFFAGKMLNHVLGRQCIGVWSWKEWEQAKLMLEVHNLEVVLTDRRKKNEEERQD